MVKREAVHHITHERRPMESDETTEKQHPAQSESSDPVRAANELLAEAAGNLAEVAAGLRRAIADGKVPTKATTKLVEYLDGVSTRMRRGTPAGLELDAPGVDGEPL